MVPLSKFAVSYEKGVNELQNGKKRLYVEMAF